MRQRPPRVIRLIPVLDFGGVESIFVLQAQFIDRARFDFRVCTFWNKGAAAKRIEAAGVRVDSLDVDPAIRNPRATARLLGYLREQRPDIVHASIGEANFHAALVARLAGVPSTIIEEQGLPSRGLSARLVHAGLYRLVQGIVGVSDAACSYLIEREFAPRARVRRIHNSARPEFFARHERPPTPEGRFRFIVVGRLVEVKNHRGLLQAFAQLVRSRPQAHLRVVGDGPLRDELSALVKQLGLNDHVEFLGFRDDVLQLMLEAEACLLASHSEGFGLVVAEAMALGTPVIGSAVGGVPEVMGALGKDWLVGPLDTAGWVDRMQRMMDLSADARVALCAASVEQAKGFAPETNIAAVQGLYEQMLAGADDVRAEPVVSS